MMMGPVMATAVVGVAEAATVDEEGLGEVVAFAEGAEEADGDLSKKQMVICPRIHLVLHSVALDGGCLTK